MNRLRLLISSGTISSRLRHYKCICLLHPRTEKKCMYIISDDSDTIFELQKISLPKRSLIIGTQICQCGDVFVLSPIDPLFCFLPALLRLEKYATVEVLIRLDNAPGFPELFRDSLSNKLDAICDSKEVCGLKAFRLNEEKLMNWLKCGISRICETARRFADPIQTRQLRAALRASDSHIAVASLCAENSPSSSVLAARNLDGSAFQNLAFQIVADKLPGQLIDRLFSCLGLTVAPTSAEENVQTECPDVRKSKLIDPDADGPIEDKSKPSPTLTSSQAKRMKTIRGTKSILSFFVKK